MLLKTLFRTYCTHGLILTGILFAGIAQAGEPVAAEASTAPVASVAEPEAAQTDKVAELERRIDILAEEIERLRIQEEPVAAGAGAFGFGPAASKIYRTDRGLSIGGYGEMLYENFAGENERSANVNRPNRIDFLRAITYIGYKFNDRILFNSELELEHAGSEVSVEFAYLDFLIIPAFNLRAGMLLAPMGLINQYHEPPVFLSARRPVIESTIIPTTWRENGVGIFGSTASGRFNYTAYLINGFNGPGNFSSAGFRGGRQKGNQALADDFAFVTRLDVLPVPGLTLGTSLYTGNSGQNAQVNGESVDARTTIWDMHLDVQYRGFQGRALTVLADQSDAAQLNTFAGLAPETGVAGIAERLAGFYVEAGFNLLSNSQYQNASVVPFLRFEKLNTQSSIPDGYVKAAAQDQRFTTIGMAYKPLAQVVFKADYMINSNEAETGVNQFNVALGYLF